MKNTKTWSPIGTYQVQSSSLKASEFLLTESSVRQNKNPQSPMKHARADTVTLYTLPTTNWLPAVWLPQFLLQDDKNPVSPPLRRPSKKDGSQEIKPVRRSREAFQAEQTNWWAGKPKLDPSWVAPRSVTQSLLSGRSGLPLTLYRPSHKSVSPNPKTVPLLRFHWVQAAAS